MLNICSFSRLHSMPYAVQSFLGLHSIQIWLGVAISLRGWCFLGRTNHETGEPVRKE